MCVDYRELNKQTVKNTYPLPRIDELVDNLAGCSVFSALDLSIGFNQFALQESDVHKTAFNTHIGKYEYTVLPMGLSNAPAVFQREMNRLFTPLLNQCVLIYLDDLLVFSKSVSDHLAHLRIGLTLAQKEGVLFKRKKCEFFKAQLRFLGHVISKEGMFPDPAKVKVIDDWPPPKTVLELRSFLGLANYFRKYIRAYASVTQPLTNLLKGLSKQEKKGKLVQLERIPVHRVELLQQHFSARWTSDCSEAFAALKKGADNSPSSGTA